MNTYNAGQNKEQQTEKFGQSPRKMRGWLLIGQLSGTALLVAMLLLTQVATAQAQASGPQGDTAPWVVGGETVAEGEMTWVVALVERDAADDGQLRQFCGGSLIAPRWVLTAAHCVAHRQADQIDVVIGRNKLGADGGERLSAETLMTHPGFQYWDLESDIALIQLSSASAFAPVALSTETVAPLLQEHTGELASVAGWGMVDEFIASPDDAMRRAEVAIVSRQDCNGAQAYDGAVGKQMLCAGWPEGGRDACFGDSGGPLVLPTEEATTGWRQIGVVSWGEGCARPQRYGVYTSVGDFAPWINASFIDSASTLCATGKGESPEGNPRPTEPSTTPQPLDEPVEQAPADQPTENGPEAVTEDQTQAADEDSGVVSGPVAGPDQPRGVFLPLVSGS